MKRIFDTVSHYRHYKRTLMMVVAISLAVHAMNIAIILILAMSLHPLGPRWEMSLLIPLGFLATALPLTPGGIGVGEAAFNKLFILAGLSGGAELLLGWRLLAIAIGFCGLAYYLQGRKPFVRDSTVLGVSGGDFSSFEKS